MSLNVTAIMTTKHNKHNAILTDDNRLLLFAWLEGLQVVKRYRVTVNTVRDKHSKHYTSLFLNPQKYKGVQGKMLWHTYICSTDMDSAFQEAKKLVRSKNFFNIGSITVVLKKTKLQKGLHYVYSKKGGE
jgi:hypothetical protein